MSNNPSLEQVDVYHERTKYLRGFYQPYLEAYGLHAFEYGMLLIKSLLTLNGGALIALPAIAGISTKESILPIIYWVAAGYIIGLILAIITSYVVHLNYMSLYSLMENQYIKNQKEAEKECLGEVSDENNALQALHKRISKQERLVLLIFLSPHGFGILSLVFFIASSFTMLKIFA